MILVLELEGVVEAENVPLGRATDAVFARTRPIGRRWETVHIARGPEVSQSAGRMRTLRVVVSKVLSVQ